MRNPAGASSVGRSFTTSPDAQLSTDCASANNRYSGPKTEENQHHPSSSPSLQEEPVVRIAPKKDLHAPLNTVASIQSVVPTQTDFRSADESSSLSLFFGVVKRPTKMAYISDFAGTTFNAKSDEWSMYHRIERDGVIERKDDRDLHTIIQNKEAVPEALTRAGLFGLAAAKIYVKVSDTKTIIMSGFWLESVYFVTCCHFFLGATFTQPERDAVVRDLKTCEKSIARVNSDVVSDRPCSNDRIVYLHAVDLEDDIAIFRLLPTHPSDDLPQSFVVRDNLLSVVSTPESELPYSIWTIAYNGDDQPLHQNVRENAFRMSPQPTTMFQYKLRYYLHTLRQSERGMKILRRIDPQQLPPKFETFFKPNQRALAVGQIYTPKDSEKIEPSKLSVAKPYPFTVLRRHTISGFWGCSGAMICMFHQDCLSSPKVVGLFRGDTNDQPENLFLAFTKEGIQWIVDNIEGGPPSLDFQNLSLNVSELELQSPFGGAS